MTTAANAPMATYRIGEQLHPLRRVPQCRVCRSHLRSQVEEALVEGDSYKAIVDRLPDAALSDRNVSEHLRRGHLPIDDEVFRRIKEDQSREAGQLIQKAVDRKIGELALARAVVERAAERLATGELEPTMTDALKAARLLERYDHLRLERDELRRQRDDAQHALTRILSLVRRLMPGRSWSALGREVDADPSLRGFWPPPTA